MLLVLGLTPRRAEHEGHGRNAYPLFALNILLSFVAMYFLMFTMVDNLGDFYNLNMGLMAVTMLAPMGILMLLLMRAMYSSQ